MAVRLIPHAEAKFGVLYSHGIILTRQQVIEAVQSPGRVLPGGRGRLVAEKAISDHLLVRVVYFMHNDDIDVITFYPARRSRYAGEV